LQERVAYASILETPAGEPRCAEARITYVQFEDRFVPIGNLMRVFPNGGTANVANMKDTETTGATVGLWAEPR
jgi:hypothetical protein